MIRQSSDELYTVASVARRLEVHPKTVLRYIRRGDLRATRLGKSYRILRADLDAFAGIPPVGPAPAEAAWVTVIVDIPGVDEALAQKWARTVTNALAAKPDNAVPLRADVVYESERSHLKILIVGAPDDTVNLLSLVRVWLEQLRA